MASSSLGCKLSVLVDIQPPRLMERTRTRQIHPGICTPTRLLLHHRAEGHRLSNDIQVPMTSRYPCTFLRSTCLTTSLKEGIIIDGFELDREPKLVGNYMSTHTSSLDWRRSSFKRFHGSFKHLAATKLIAAIAYQARLKISDL